MSVAVEARPSAMVDDEDGSRRFGFVAFDDPQDPKGGWAAIGDGCKRIVNPGQLSTDAIWWSNVGYQTFFREREVWRQPNLRHQQYLVINPEDILREWGYDPSKVSVDFYCKFVANAYDRIMRVSLNLLRDVNPRLRATEAFVSKTLREDFRICLPEMEYPRGESAVVMKRGLSFEEFTPTGAKSPRGSKRIVLRKPRLSYAMQMLQTPVPRGPYVLLDRKALKEATNSGDRVRYVQEATQPMMMDVSLTIQPEVSSIYGFGAAADKGRRVPRSWVAHSEFHNLSRLAEIEVRNVWKGETYWGMLTEIPESVKDFLSDKRLDMSWTAGILAETIWRAATLGEDRAKARGLTSGDETGDTSWQGLWIRGADKASMFVTALRLSELGYSVGSYGLGWIRCSVPEEETENFVRDGLSLGLVPQMSELHKGMFAPGDIPWGGDPKCMGYVQLLLEQNSNLLWIFDRISLVTPDKRPAFIQAIRKKLGERPTDR